MASSSMHLHVRSDAVLSGPGHGPQTVAADAECALVASGNVGAVYVYAWRKRDVSEEKRGDVSVRLSDRGELLLYKCSDRRVGIHPQIVCCIVYMLKHGEQDKCFWFEL